MSEWMRSSWVRPAPEAAAIVSCLRAHHSLASYFFVLDSAGRGGPWRPMEAGNGVLVCVPVGLDPL